MKKKYEWRCSGGWTWPLALMSYSKSLFKHVFQEGRKSPTIHCKLTFGSVVEQPLYTIYLIPHDKVKPYIYFLIFHCSLRMSHYRGETGWEWMLFDVGFGLLLMHRSGASIKRNDRENMKSSNSFTYLFEVLLREKCFTHHWMRLEEIKCLKRGKKTFCQFVWLSVRCDWSHSSTYCTDWFTPIHRRNLLNAWNASQFKATRRSVGTDWEEAVLFSFELGWSKRGSASWEISGLFLELAWEFRRRSPRKF